MIIYSTNKEQTIIRARHIEENSQKEVMSFIKNGKVWVMNDKHDVWGIEEDETFTKETVTNGNNESYIIITSSGIITPARISDGESILNLAKRMMDRLKAKEVIIIGQSSDCFDIPTIKFESYCYYCGPDPADISMSSN